MMKSQAIWASACHHIGARSCNLPLLQSHIELARKEKWEVALVGDIIDNGVSAGSKHLGLEWGDALTPQAQIELAFNLFEPIRDQVRVIFGGNHALRSMRAVGNHPEKVLALLLSRGVGGSLNASRAAQLVALYTSVQDDPTMSPKEKGRRGKGIWAEAKALFTGTPWGAASRWPVRFFPGLGALTIAGLNVIGHHGVHVRTRSNWNRLEAAGRGYDLYLTAHNHRLETGLICEEIQGHTKVAHAVSVGTYQGLEEYAQIALYGVRTVPGSALIIVENGKVRRTEFLLEK